MKTKIIIGLIILVFFVGVIFFIIQKDGETQQRTDEIARSTINNVLNAETEEPEEEKQSNVLAEHEYNIDDDRFVFVFSEKDGEHSLNLICYINDKSDAFWTHISLNALFNNPEDMKWLIDDLNFSYSIMIGDGVVLIRSKDSLTLMSVDDGFISVGDYFSTEWMTESAGTSDYGEQVGGFLVDFIQNY